MYSILLSAGWPIWPLLIISIVGLAIVIERAWYLRQIHILPKITITVAGATCSGKTFIKHQIAKHLDAIGLAVSVEEIEMTEKAVHDRMHNPEKFVKAMNDKKMVIEVVEKQLNNSTFSKI